MNKVHNKKLTARDAIQIGIYAALILFAIFIGSSIGYLPILYPFAPFTAAIVAGPVFFLFLSKVHRFGLIFILSSIIGGFYALTGHGIYSFAGGILLGLLADYICSIGNYRSFKWITLGYGVFSSVCATTFLPMILAADDYYDYIKGMMGVEYTTKVQGIMQGWVFPLVFLGAFLGGILGAYLGRKATRAHFRKSGAMGR